MSQENEKTSQENEKMTPEKIAAILEATRGKFISDMIAAHDRAIAPYTQIIQNMAKAKKEELQNRVQRREAERVENRVAKKARKATKAKNTI